MWFNDSSHGWMMSMGMPLGIVLWIIVLLAGVVLWKWLNGSVASISSKSPTTRELLDQRYASGEIGREEYEHKKSDIAG